ncbi:hypothetical protein NJC40_07010 [Pseudomonas sp. 21LCFQ02]|uniref:hypothetical protein n=1 Tax=Pseudomonas sp. 21LCFQ02 TaxID=2957505 RepID=UPI00209B371D|nr:hypothetical protein [Pseudomonas sp. 21LCFQ02]MCO8167522.1 hypothetical protein [Pseudomonas sp. 21LCFQ02]
MRRIFSTLSVLALLQGCSTHTTSPSGCEANFHTEGSLITGKRFSTSASLPKTSSDLAFKRLYTLLARDGYYIQSTDEKKGIISSYQNVNLSNKRAPLNAIVEKEGMGSRVSLVFVAAAGIYTPEAGASNEFCRIINEVEVSQ